MINFVKLHADENTKIEIGGHVACMGEELHPTRCLLRHKGEAEV
jgi:hypothetical protein